MIFNDFYEQGQITHAWACDKGSSHSYIEHYYDLEFTNKRREALNILEIGIWEGASMKLWKSWFVNANIIGIDNSSGIFGNKSTADATKIPGVELIWDDSYSDSVVNKFEDNYFDYIIDDGHHTLESHKLCIEKWLPKLKHGGKCVIEDIYYLSQDPAPLIGNELISLLDINLYSYQFFDLRLSKDRGDDIILEITKK